MLITHKLFPLWCLSVISNSIHLFKAIWPLVSRCLPKLINFPVSSFIYHCISQCLVSFSWVASRKEKVLLKSTLTFCPLEAKWKHKAYSGVNFPKPINNLLKYLAHLGIDFWSSILMSYQRLVILSDIPGTSINPPGPLNYQPAMTMLVLS